MVFGRNFSENGLERWSKSVSFEGHPSVDITNRVFTPAHISPSLLEKRVSPPADIDPSGILATISEEGKLLYLPDNGVLYFAKRVNQETGEVE